ncbi:MAG: hypothetical protein PT965_07015 [Clostridia bacterium]|nr:hypothetical protein [Clostridia bacterium]
MKNCTTLGTGAPFFGKPSIAGERKKGKRPKRKKRNDPRRILFGIFGIFVENTEME